MFSFYKIFGFNRPITSYFFNSSTLPTKYEHVEEFPRLKNVFQDKSNQAPSWACNINTSTIR